MKPDEVFLLKGPGSAIKILLQVTFYHEEQ